MTRSRMMKNDDPTDDSTASPRTTIVGGQPSKTTSPAPPIPTGIQTLVRLASVDAAFLDELVTRRSRMGDVAGVQLTSSERAILDAIPDGHLRDMALKMPPPAPDRRDFLRQSAASAVVLLGGAAMADTLTGCCDALERIDVNPMATGGGAAPDWPDEPTPGDDDDSAQPTPPEPPTEPPPTDPPPPVTRGAKADMPPRKPKG